MGPIGSTISAGEGLMEADGETEALADGDGLGLVDVICEGEILGETLGETDGETLPPMEGDSDGEMEADGLTLAEGL